MRKTVFKVKNLSEHEDRGSNGLFLKQLRTRERSQFGNTLEIIGFSSSTLLTISERTGSNEKLTEEKCFSVEDMADLYPLRDKGDFK